MDAMNQLRLQLKNACVGIAGAGGLGSNCAVALARVGVGKIIVADFDKVELSNLNRQYYFYDQIGLFKVDALKENIHRIDPNIQLETHKIKLNSENIVPIFAHCHVVVEAFDQALMKRMIIQTIGVKLPQIPLVSGIGMAGWGKSTSITVQDYGNLYVCGDQESGVDETHPPLAPRVGIVANMEANQVLEILLKGFEIKDVTQ